ncbi:hypothetical protein GUK30_10210 [Rhizobium leguminosarum]|uniref:hypothetical protein n=1 Tax=Rhizobium ruizarguesonis TaxID=2081791 RepID=UPI0013C09368|nr:hypothetical protein [Rhizobium ruizarguesonis]NEI19785.1 hypothetical protein [Rhizobium ruizarguesonis]
MKISYGEAFVSATNHVSAMLKKIFNKQVWRSIANFLLQIRAWAACILGAMFWLGIALAVAMPGKWFTSTWSSLSATFLDDHHYLFIGFLLFVDLAIEIVVLGHQALSATMGSGAGFSSLVLVLAAMVIPAAAEGGDAAYISEKHVIVFALVVGLFLAFKFLMYKAAHPLIGNHKVQQKLTAIPVHSLPPKDE